jgi:hypothetical protein
MDDNPTIIETPGLFRNKTVKKLIFTEGGLTIEKPLSFDPVVFVPAEDIVAFRYGIKWLSGYAFTIGRTYLVEIQDNKGQIIPVKLPSLYGIKKNVYLDIWAGIIEQLWLYYLKTIFEGFYNQYKNKERFDLSGVEFHPFGIMLNGKGLFWDEIALSNYKTYFVVHGRENVKLLWSCNFKNDWNAYLLQKLLKTIIKDVDELKAPGIA